MLVLTRKLDQTIRIGENITITILKVRGNTVRVGIDAPREVPVIRGELERELAMDVPQSVTIEFKSKPDKQSGALRVVCENGSGSTVNESIDVEMDASSEKESSSDREVPSIPIITANRLQQLAAKIAHFE